MENIQKKMFFICKFSADIFLSFVLPIQPKFFVSDPQQSQQHSDSERRYIGIKKYQSQTEFSLSVFICFYQQIKAGHDNKYSMIFWIFIVCFNNT